MDLYEDRKGFNNEPFGDYAWDLLAFIKAANGRIVVTDILFAELQAHYSIEQINGLFKQFEGALLLLTSTPLNVGKRLRCPKK